MSGTDKQSQPTPAIPAPVVLEMVANLMKFPFPTICRHSVAADLLSALEAVGYPVSDDLAKAVVTADDDTALELLAGASE